MKSAVEIVREFLENTAADKITAAAERLVASDATYISLSFYNPNLKKILPWTGIGHGREAYINTFMNVAKFWTIEDFGIGEMFGTEVDVAAFGAFSYKSNSLGKSFRSPLAIHAKVKDEKIVYFMFMEDTFASARSFSSGGIWTIQTEVGGMEFQV